MVENSASPASRGDSLPSLGSAPGVALQPGSDPVDVYFDAWMRGAAPPLEDFCAQQPNLAAEQRQQLERLVTALRGRASPRPAAQNILPERLGPYRLLDQLGAGGMGVVYRAKDERLGREVALKLLHPALSSRSATRARFEREAKALATLSHPHLVTLYDADLDHEPPYLAMELMPGQNLEQLLKAAQEVGRRVPLRRVLELGRQIATGLAAAHRAGVLHRDVKPSNVLLDRQGQAKLGDFGLAVLSGSQTLSQTDQFHGTLAYAAPEQIHGRSSELDGRTDVWGLGVLLYEAICGRLPFQGQRMEQVLQAILSSEPIEPRRLVPDLPRDVETVVLKALVKHRGQRYASAEALGEDLTALLEHRPIRARPQGALTHAALWCRRHPGAALAAGLGTLLILGGPLAYATIQARHATSLSIERNRLVQRTQELQQLAGFQGELLRGVDAESIGDQLVQGLRSGTRAAWLRSGLEESAIEQQERELDRLVAGLSATDLATDLIEAAFFQPAAEALEARFVAQPLVRGELELTLAAAHRALGRPQLALDCADRAAAALALAGEPAERLFKARRERALALYDLSDATQAEAELRALAAEALTRHAPDSIEVCQAQTELVALLIKASRFQEALALAEEVQVHAEQLGDVEVLESCSNNLGLALLRSGRLADAEVQLTRVLESRRSRLGLSAHDTLGTLGTLASLYYRQGQYEQGIALLRSGLEVARGRYGSQHPMTLMLANNLGTLLSANDEDSEAERLYREVYEGRRTLFGPFNPDTLRSANNLGTLLREAGRLEEAAVLLEAAAEDTAQIQGPLHDDTLTALSNLSFLREEQGDLEAASQLLHTVLERRLESGGAAHPKTQEARHNLAGLLRAQGSAEQALEHSNLAHRDALELHGATNVYTQAFLRERLRCLTALGRWQEADGLALEAWQALLAGGQAQGEYGDLLLKVVDEILASWDSADQSAAVAARGAWAVRRGA
jgi:eukaryotic-like serine/threonine-protein kinase